MWQLDPVYSIYTLFLHTILFYPGIEISGASEFIPSESLRSSGDSNLAKYRGSKPEYDE